MEEYAREQEKLEMDRLKEIQKIKERKQREEETRLKQEAL